MRRPCPTPAMARCSVSLVHILDAEYAWRSLLQHGEWAAELKPDDFATLDLAVR